jgi:hypothetical protein
MGVWIYEKEGVCVCVCVLCAGIPCMNQNIKV